MKFPAKYDVIKDDLKGQLKVLSSEQYGILSIAEIMDLRINFSDHFPDLRGNGFYSSNLMATNSEGDVKILERDYFLKENLFEILCNKNCSDEFFEKIHRNKSLYLSKNECDEISNKGFGKGEYENSSLLNFLVEGNAKLLNQYWNYSSDLVRGANSFEDKIHPGHLKKNKEMFGDRILRFNFSGVRNNEFSPMFFGTPFFEQAFSPFWDKNYSGHYFIGKKK